MLRILVLLLLSLAKGASAQEPPLSAGQSLYLPIYSHIYHGEINPGTGKPSETLVSTLVSIRNTDPKSAITVRSARYYNTNGVLLKEFLSAPKRLPALGTHELFVPRSDVSGGSGANFIIEWFAEQPVNPPIVEALHGDIRESRTLLFTTSARPILPR